MPRKSDAGALRTLELLLRHFEQARTSLAALPLQYVPQRTAVEELDFIQFFIVIYPVCLFAAKSGCIS